jgi:hypothetical protein
MANPHRFQLPFFKIFQAEVDSEAILGREIRQRLTERRLFTAMPNKHSGDIVNALDSYYSVLESAARAVGRLPPEKYLLGRVWTLAYDIYSPRLHRFIEIDERQHFSAPRLERMRHSRESPLEANYPPYFWEHVLPRLLEAPSTDKAPPYRDEQRAYLDLARELVPLQYGFKPTLRIDQWSVKRYQDDIKPLLEALLGSDWEKPGNRLNQFFLS